MPAPGEYAARRRPRGLEQRRERFDRIDFKDPIGGDKMVRERRWQDYLNLILGIWLFLSPWLLSYSGTNTTASWNAWIFGVALVVFSAIAVSMPQTWEEIINLLIGIWMVISPWVLGFTGARSPESNAVIVGILAIVFSVWAMAMRRTEIRGEHVDTSRP
jgi:hypothetical protein